MPKNFESSLASPEMVGRSPLVRSRISSWKGWTLPLPSETKKSPLLSALIRSFFDIRERSAFARLVASPAGPVCWGAMGSSCWARYGSGRSPPRNNRLAAREFDLQFLSRSCGNCLPQNPGARPRGNGRGQGRTSSHGVLAAHPLQALSAASAGLAGERLFHFGQLRHHGSVDLAVAPNGIVHPGRSAVPCGELPGFAANPIDMPDLVLGDRTQHS